MRHAAAAVPAAGLAGLLLACATTQNVRIDCVPEDVVIYVDGRLLEEKPEQLQLDAERDHMLYFKGPGYVPELVVLRSERDDDGPRLSEDALCVQPRYVGTDRELELDVDAPPPAAPPP